MTVVRTGTRGASARNSRGVGAGQVGDRAQHPLLPQVAVGEGGDVGHVDAGAHDGAAGRDGAQRGGHERPDRGEDQRRVERLGPGRRRVAGPLGAERARERLRAPRPPRG